MEGEPMPDYIQRRLTIKPPKGTPPNRKYIKKSVRKEVFHKYGGTCAYCGRPIAEYYFHVDHIHPVSLGGTNDFDNLNPACPKCNLFKSGMPLEEYRKVYAFSRRDTPYFSERAIEWLKEHVESLGIYVEGHTKHVFPFEKEK